MSSSDWFQDLTGFREVSPDQVRANLELRKSTIVSKVNGRQLEVGDLQTPTLQELRELVSADSTGKNRLELEEVVGDVQHLHTTPEAEGALFQVASQFNLLEMTSPSVTPEEGVAKYARDATQGPACAIAAGGGTIYRNYFVPVNGQIGQTADNQIDCLKTLGDALGNVDDRLWQMKNGYALASEAGLLEICEYLSRINNAEREHLCGKLRIGLQRDTEVTIAGLGHLVSQVYCSALPISYSPHAREIWRDFACLVLDAAYEATLAAAVINSMRTGNHRVYLTLLGGGAFGNATDWITSSIKKALTRYRAYPLQVKVVSYGSPNPRIRELM